MRQRSPKEFLKFRADPTLRRAIRLRAALEDKELQEVIVDVLRKGLSAEIDEVQRRGLVDQPPQADEPKKAGRKRKEETQE